MWMVAPVAAVLDVHARVAGEVQVLVDVEPGVDDGGDARALIADHVRGAAEVVVRDLAEQHQRLTR
jgi:hypothetical protein